MKSVIQKILLPVITGLLLFSCSIPALAEDQPEKPIVYFGIIPLYTPQLIYERFQPLMDYLSDNTPYRFKMRLTKDYKGIMSLLQEGKIDIALLGGTSYCLARDKLVPEGFNQGTVPAEPAPLLTTAGAGSAVVSRGRKRGIELIPILKSLNIEGKPFHRSIIITRKDKEINNISELKGKSFAFASRWSTSGATVPLYHLYNNGIGLKNLSMYFHLRYHDSVVREVLKGNYDAGAVIDTIAHSYKDKGLKFIFISDPIPELTIVVRKEASHTLVDYVKNALLKLKSEDTAREEWGEEIRYGFTDASDSDFDSIRNMIKYLKGQGVYLRDDED